MLLYISAKVRETGRANVFDAYNDIPGNEKDLVEEGEAKRDDENFFYVACWEYQGDDEKAPILIKEPLVYEAIKVQTRNYKS